MSQTAWQGLGCRTVFDDAIDTAVNPGAGDYDVSAALKHTKPNSPSITIESRYKSSPEQFSVGPGYYDIDAKKSIAGAGFPKSERFAAKAVYSPGPADYDGNDRSLKSTQATFSRSGLRASRTLKSEQPDVGSYEVESSFKRTSKCKTAGAFTFGGRYKGKTY